MNRKSQMWVLEFALKMVLALVLMFFVFTMARKCVGNTSEGLDSFKNLIEKINSIEEDEMLSVPLVMDKKTMMLYFNKDSNQVGFVKVEGNIINIIFGHGDSVEYIERPSNCNEGKACACLCQGDMVEEEGGYESKLPILQQGYDSVRYYHCHKILSCIETNKPIGIRTDIKKSSQIGTVNIYDHIFKGGFFLEREILSGSDKSRIRTVYLQNYQKSLILCTIYPCLTKENKQEIDSLLNPVGSETIGNQEDIYSNQIIPPVNNDPTDVDTNKIFANE